MILLTNDSFVKCCHAANFYDMFLIPPHNLLNTSICYKGLGFELSYEIEIVKCRCRSRGLQTSWFPHLLYCTRVPVRSLRVLYLCTVHNTSIKKLESKEYTYGSEAISAAESRRENRCARNRS